MRITTDQYEIELPGGHAADIIAGIDDETVRDSILSAIETTEGGDPVRLSIALGDALLDAFSEWERTQEGGGE